MTSETKTGNLITPKARLSYPNLLEARAQTNPDTGQLGEAKFSCALIFDEAARATPEYKAMQRAALEAAEAKWPGKKLAFSDTQFNDLAEKHGAAQVVKVRAPFRNGVEKSMDGYGAGKTFINATSKQPPQVVSNVLDKATGKLKKITEEKDIYAGCYVRASLSVYTYDQKGNKGVAFGLRNVQFLSDGEPLGNRTFADDEFEPLGDDAASGDVDEMFAGT